MKSFQQINKSFLLTLIYIKIKKAKLKDEVFLPSLDAFIHNYPILNSGVA